jgi:hypothetical protein
MARFSIVSVNQSDSQPVGQVISVRNSHQPPRDSRPWNCKHTPRVPFVSAVRLRPPEVRTKVARPVRGCGVRTKVGYVNRRSTRTRDLARSADASVHRAVVSFARACLLLVFSRALAPLAGRGTDRPASEPGLYRRSTGGQARELGMHGCDATQLAAASRSVGMAHSVGARVCGLVRA